MRNTTKASLARPWSLRVCYGMLRHLQGNPALVEAILSAYAIGGWDPACELWVDAGLPKL